MFIDTAKIYIRSGNGGNGVISFRREKYIAYGGPDGGDGGKGGDVIFISDQNMSTLMDFRYKRKYVAANGENGQGNNKYGKDAKDLYIKVPVGTQIIRDDTNELIADLKKVGQKVIVLRGGKGGKGNAKFATSTLKTPRFAESGDEGNELWIRLELKLLADVGLVGFPNAGKSTLLSACTRAKPKIASYPFTTLSPNLGVVNYKWNTFVMADIPGLIEGAHSGEGLGFDFLRHIERTKLILHIVDIEPDSGGPIENIDKINKELNLYSGKLKVLPQIIVMNKIDKVNNGKIDEIKRILDNNGINAYFVSALTGEGIDKLLDKTIEMLDKINKSISSNSFEDDDVIIYNLPKKEDNLNIEVKGNTFYISGTKIDRLLKRINLQDENSLRYFEKNLRKAGVIDELKKRGLKNGDVLNIRDFEYEYYD